jgi:ankyrin repeat protein
MKTVNIALMRTFRIKTLGIAALLFMIACSSKQESVAQNGAAKVTKAPDVDIHTAVLTDNQKALEQHIAAGSDLNEKDPYGGSSPLITAAVFGKTAMAKLLIDAGADINFKNNENSTALHSAAFFCRPEIVKMLLAKQADKTIRNKYNATPYESVITPFQDVKPAYDMMVQLLGPMGLKLDYAYLEKTRPEIAAMLK